ncbi:MAG: Rab family GTPase, partial [Candidatus Hermodarchaeota archaeon]
GVLLVYDRANRTSFERAAYWLKEVRRGCGDVPVILVANKADLDAVVKPEEGQNFAEEHSLSFVETSAKTDLNTDLAFSILAGQVIETVG